MALKIYKSNPPLSRSLPWPHPSVSQGFLFLAQFYIVLIGLGEVMLKKMELACCSLKKERERNHQEGSRRNEATFRAE